MEIIRKVVPFEQITPGSCFKSSDNYYFMRLADPIDDIEGVVDSESSVVIREDTIAIRVNCVELGTGDCTYFRDDEMVTPVKCKLLED